MKGLKLFILSLLFVSSCKLNDTPEDIIEQQKMVRIMADLHVMDGYMASLVYTDTLRVSGKNFYATVYNSHNTTKALYEKSLKYYSMDPVLLDSMYSRVEKLLTEKERRINKAKLKEPNKPQKQK